jgi:hypothetical protein
MQLLVLKEAGFREGSIHGSNGSNSRACTCGEARLIMPRWPIIKHAESSGLHLRLPGLSEGLMRDSKRGNFRYEPATLAIECKGEFATAAKLDKGASVTLATVRIRS